jgi:hypothetical protein
MLLFNCSVWYAVRRVQADGLCPQGDGSLVIFGISDASVANAGCLMAFIFSIFDVIWEGVRWLGELLRMVMWNQRHNEREMARQIAFDARLWWIARSPSDPRLDWERTCRVVSRLSWFVKFIAFLYVCVTTEITVYINNLGELEDRWTFGQTYAITMMLALFVVVCIRYHFLGTRFLYIISHQYVTFGMFYES